MLVGCLGQVRVTMLICVTCFSDCKCHLASSKHVNGRQSPHLVRGQCEQGASRTVGIDKLDIVCKAWMGVHLDDSSNVASQHIMIREIRRSDYGVK